MKKFSFNESTFIKQQQQKSRYEDCWGKKSLHIYVSRKQVVIGKLKFIVQPVSTEVFTHFKNLTRISI
jgi:hypothetical protein